MDSLASHFDSFIVSCDTADAEQRNELERAFHAGAAAVCSILSQADPEQNPHLIKELQQEEHAFGKKAL